MKRTMQRTASFRSAGLWTVAIAAISLTLCSLPSDARVPSGPFSDMAGSWYGGGRIYTAQGAEPIRCRARYAVDPSGLTARQTLVCASPDYRFNVNSTVGDYRGTVSGTWSETSHNLNGQIVGLLRGDRIEARILGSSFSANLSLVTRGDDQAVTIVPAGNGTADVREVSVTLRRT